ncbi:hypothetical protein RvY_08810-2 [Ramazzottius varieornatus]|uniref:Uncharacterized protein n=1 Tax=Ramazzottius varieornatus TaxID=947166 RepID=A0A1D1V9S7_RAMVA|nr:hypothetical protein RvY_08810-2 [Ramazzottius varieornatus]
MDSDSDRSDSLCAEPLSPFKNDQELEKERRFIPEMLKFSIENILRPDFGCKIKRERLSPRPDFSSLHSSDNQSKAASNLGNWPPAWVFCTRYSDRPSAGKPPVGTLNFHVT